MNKRLLQLLVVSAFIGTQINASVIATKAIKLQPMQSNPEFVAGIYNGSTTPVWISDNNGHKYGSTANGSWIGTEHANTLYIWTNSSYNGEFLQLTLAGRYTDTAGNCALTAIFSALPEQPYTLFYPGIGTNSIGITYNTMSGLLSAQVTG